MAPARSSCWRSSARSWPSPPPFGHDVEDHLKAAGFTDSASESERATALLRDELGHDPTPGIVLLVRDRDGGRLDDLQPGGPARGRPASAASWRGPSTSGASSTRSSDRRGARSLIARDGRSLAVTGHLSTQDVEDEGGVAAEDAKRRISSDTLDVAMGGFAPSFNEVNDQTRTDLTKAELIAFPILALLLLLVFRGVVAAAIPLLIGVFSIIGTFLVLRVMSGIVDTSLFALNIATGLSLGLAVDYALLLVSRYREELEREGGATREAHRRTVMTAGPHRAVLRLHGRGGDGLARRAARSASCTRWPSAGAAVGILSAVIAMLVVPSLLALLGTRINALAIRRGPAVSDESDGWYRLAWGVMRRPVAVALASAGLLLAASAPLLFTTLTGPSAEAVPPGQPSYAVNEYLEDSLPARRHRGDHGDRPRRDRGRAARAAGPPHLGHRRHRGRSAVHPRRRAHRVRELRTGAGRPVAPQPGRGRRDPRARGAGRGARCSSRATPPASSTRSRASWTTCRSSARSSPAPPCCCCSCSPAR